MTGLLGYISEQMAALEIPYEYMEWSSEVKYPYVVGEYLETPTMTEDGSKEYAFILTATTRGKWIELEEIKEKLEKHFPACGGRRSTINGGDAIAVFYSHSTTVPTGEMDLKRMQYELKIKIWKGFD